MMNFRDAACWIQLRVFAHCRLWKPPPHGMLHRNPWVASIAHTGHRSMAASEGHCSEITAGNAFMKTVQRAGKVLEDLQKEEQEKSREEQAERWRCQRPPSRCGALHQALQNHLQESQFSCHEMTGTIDGRVGYGDAEILAPFLTLKWQFGFEL